MSDIPVFIMTFMTGFLLVFVINLVLTDLYRRRQRMLDRRMEQNRLQHQRDEVHRRAVAQQRALADATQSEELQQLADEAFARTGRTSGMRIALREMIEQSGLTVTVRNLLLSSVVIGVSAGAVVYVLLTSVIWSLVAVVGVGALPIGYVQMKRRQRLDALREQLPDAFDLMGRVLRAGQTMSQAMLSVSQEFRPPLAMEFAYCYEQQNLGISPELAMRDLARRTGLLEVKIFVLSVLVQRQVGGNLAELLENLANVVRERFRLRGKIRALTAEGRFQAIILIALPIVVWFGILFGNPDYALRLFEHPNLLIGTLVGMTIGALWIRKIINFEF